MNEIVWMDMEMTGLDPERDRVLEVAVLITDGDLNEIAMGPHLIVHQPEDILKGMDEWNTTHHKQSGLTDLVRISTCNEQQAEQELLAFLQKHTKRREAPLAGNSIYQDRRFLTKYMPSVEAWLHYRMIDVSSIKELVRRWQPKVHDGRPDKKVAHRAIDDIRESIEELGYYRQHAFAATNAQSTPK